MGRGVTDTKWISEEKRDKILRLGDIELKFEEERRRIAPDAASRLCCLWVADDSEIGKSHIRRMLGPNTHILRVTIPSALRFSKVDTKWFNAYCSEPKLEYIENYWGSVPYDESVPTWEYLVEGMIEVNDPEGLEYICKYGSKP